MKVVLTVLTLIFAFGQHAFAQLTPLPDGEPRGEDGCGPGYTYANGFEIGAEIAREDNGLECCQAGCSLYLEQTIERAYELGCPSYAEGVRDGWTAIIDCGEWRDNRPDDLPDPYNPTVPNPTEY